MAHYNVLIMPIFQKGQPTTGYSTVDREIDRIYKFLKSIQTGIASTSTITNSTVIDTPIGGRAIRVSNGGGVVLPAGHLVRPAAEYKVQLADENSRDVVGVIYEDIPVYGDGYMVIIGWCDVYFNQAGAVAGNYFRMSKTNDTVNTDAGLAHSETITKIDTFMLKGYIFESRVGAGLARCIKL